MPYIHVDESRCARDGLCASVCPMSVIEHSPSAVPHTNAEKAGSCISCGHCMAVCPRDALLLGDVTSDELRPLERSSFPTAAALESLLCGRRSIRRFSSEPVERKTTEALLDVARYAPSGKNTQPLRWTVVTGLERVRDLSHACVEFYRAMTVGEPAKAKVLGAFGLVRSADAGQDRILYAAPQVIVAHGAATHPMLAGSAMIALTYLEIAAAARGLGTCWAGYLQIASADLRVRDVLQLPDGDAVAGAMMLGRPNITYRKIPPRRPLDVRWL
jgi:nitroreductase/NAD-dependent dihydropyrimidine dehydrogenase PreA subunit